MGMGKGRSYFAIASRVLHWAMGLRFEVFGRFVLCQETLRLYNSDYRISQTLLRQSLLGCE
jgi:hypothetical protein